MKRIFVALIVFLAFAGCIQQQETGNTNTVDFSVKVVDAQGSTVLGQELTGLEGQSVFQALTSSGIEMEYDDTGFGPFVTSIGGITAGQNEYIAVYQNGEYANAGIGDLPAEEGSTIEFRVEKIE